VQNSNEIGILLLQIAVIVLHYKNYHEVVNDLRSYDCPLSQTPHCWFVVCSLPGTTTIIHPKDRQSSRIEPLSLELPVQAMVLTVGSVSILKRLQPGI